MTTTQYLLDASRMPKHWYNIAADLPSPPPAVLHPGTLQPIGPADLAPLFPMELILQEVSTEREIPIPEPVRDVYKLWRPVWNRQVDPVALQALPVVVPIALNRVPDPVCSLSRTGISSPITTWLKARPKSR